MDANARPEGAGSRSVRGLFARGSLGRRIGLGYGAVLALLGLVGALVLLLTVRIHDHTRDAMARSELAITVTELLNDHNEIHNRLWQYVQGPAGAALAEETDARRCLLGRWYYGDGPARVLAQDPACRDALSRLEEPHEQYHAALSEVAATHDPAETLRLWTTRARPAMVKIRLAMIELQGRLSEAVRRQNRAVLTLTAEAELVQALAQVVALVLAMILAWHSARRVSLSLDRITARVSLTSAELLAATEQQTRGAEAQVLAIAESTAAVETLLQEAERATRGAAGISERAAQTGTIGADGRRAVSQTVVEAGAAQTTMEQAVETIRLLAERIQAATEVVSVVEDFADRSAVLALNATIEAIHAGDQGRTFAVVASEMRSLAEQSKEATAQIRQILAAIGTAVTGSEAAADATRARVRATVQALSQADQTIARLAALIDGAVREAAEAMTSSAEQRTTAGRFGEAMRAIEAEAARSREVAQRVARAAQDLDGLGSQLQAMTRGRVGRADTHARGTKS